MNAPQRVKYGTNLRNVRITVPNGSREIIFWTKLLLCKVAVIVSAANTNTGPTRITLR